MKIFKSQGSGNDFIIVDTLKYPLADGQDYAKIAPLLCDADKGLGTDGVLFVEGSVESHAKMRIFNADGSEAMMCGNGLRCFARYIMDQKHVDDIYVETVKATYRVNCDIHFDDALNGYHILLDNVQHYGQTDFTQAYKEVLKSPLDFEYLTVSNPHAVTFTDEIPTDEILIHYGEFANREKAYFKEGANVNFVTILGDNKLYVRTYERGVGITKSCGTGMTSSVTTYAINHHKIGEWVDIYNDGGMIKCKVNAVGDHYEVDFVGNATYEYEIEADREDIYSDRVGQLERKYYSHEAEQFQAFFEATRKALKLNK